MVKFRQVGKSIKLNPSKQLDAYIELRPIFNQRLLGKVSYKVAQCCIWISLYGHTIKYTIIIEYCNLSFIKACTYTGIFL